MADAGAGEGRAGLGRTLGATLVGLDAHVVEIESHVSAGLVSWSFTGLADAAVQESRDRVRSALLACGQAPPQARVTVNLVPASVPKTGSGLDLGVAVSVLAALGRVPGAVRRVGHVGELGLDGRVRPVRGVLPLVLGLARAGVGTVVVPAPNAREAALVPGVEVWPVASLANAVALHRGEPAAADTADDAVHDPAADPAHHAAGDIAGGPSPGRARNGAAGRGRYGVAGPAPDLADVVGQPLGRRALEIAAAGGHHLLLQGPPGAGKTMLAARLPGLLPELGDDDAITVTAIHSVSGAGAPAGLVRRPPFEAPHHTSSMAAVIGGGTGLPRPGAVSRAHAGVLLLDEAPEFARPVVEALRQPLEHGEVVIHRSRGAATLPARFQLVLTANPCPCGGGADCACPSPVRRRYAMRLSGPVLDRVDLRVELPPVSALRWAETGPAESTGDVASRVAAARGAAAERWRRHGAGTNAGVAGRVLRGPSFRLPPHHVRRLVEAVDRGWMTGRGFDKTLRTAWTLADLAGRATPTVADVEEALDLRARA